MFKKLWRSTMDSCWIVFLALGTVKTLRNLLIPIYYISLILILKAFQIQTSKGARHYLQILY